jgi:uncharacterized protein (TIGR03437 family)
MRLFQQMVSWEKCTLSARLIAFFVCASSAAAQFRSMDLQQTHYQVRPGEPVAVAASSETLEFLRSAKSRSVQFAGAKAAGLAIAPNRSGQMVLAASVRAKPGTYNVAVTATSASGEVRQSAMTVEVQPSVSVPKTAARNPVVLLNGWEIGFNNACPVSASSSDTFGNLAQYLVADGVPVVYLFDNCLEDPGASIETLGNDLGDFLQTILYDDGTQVPQIDLVGFSLGGLIARSYLAGLQPDETLTPPATTLVGKLVLLATPNFGSFVAGNYFATIGAGTQASELMPGSAFLWNLANWNQRSDDVRGISTIAIVGNSGVYLPSLSAGTQLNNASDGIVSETSASAGFIVGELAASTRVVPYCHVDPSAFVNSTLGTFLCSAGGIANVTSASHPTSQIVRSFLGGTADWKSIGTAASSDAYLSSNGGLFFALGATGGGFASDLTSVTWGSLQLTVGGDTNVIYYDDFVKGTGTFSATSTSLGTFNCNNYTQAAGFFSAVRCKINAAIFSIGPLISTIPKVVSAGGAITISGADLSTQCINCAVTATPAGSSSAQTLQVNSWTNNSITAVLPSSMTGLITIAVHAVTGTDTLAIMAAAPSPSTISAAPDGLAFTFVAGGDLPAAQTIQITNSASGTLAWTAAAADSWLSVSPSSGTAPSTLSVSISSANLSAGTYSSSIQITAPGASNTPLSIPITLTVTQSTPTPPVLTVAPQTLSFTYTVGAAVPASQTVAITNTGAGDMAWKASSSDYWLTVSPASGAAPSTLTISINPANLAAGTYTSAVQVAADGATGSPASVAITLTVQGTQAAPVITAVANAGGYQTNIASAGWVSIFGSNLSSSTYSWQSSDFINGMLPTSLQGVSVTINGKAAFVNYISPTQINVLAPDDSTTGTVQVQVTTAQQAGNAFGIAKNQFSPALFTIDNGVYAAALHADYSLVAPVNLISGVTSTPAKPGETIQFYATGFGPTNPASPSAQLVTTPEPLANPVQVTIGGQPATVVYAGLVESGTYQLNVTVPNVANGDQPVATTIGGVTSQTGVSITVQQ